MIAQTDAASLVQRGLASTAPCHFVARNRGWRPWSRRKDAAARHLTNAARNHDMPGYPFADVIKDAESVRQIMGTPGELVIRKQLDHMDTHARRSIARSPFMLVGTSGPEQLGDVSPRGDAPGFALVLDDNTLANPERPVTGAWTRYSISCTPKAWACCFWCRGLGDFAHKRAGVCRPGRSAAGAHVGARKATSSC